MPGNHEKRNFQATVLKAIQGVCPPRGACETLAPRLQYLLGPDAVGSEVKTQLFVKFCRFGQRLPVFVISRLVKSMCNAWCTTRRCHQGPARCRLGCMNFGGGNITQYAPCYMYDPAVALILLLLPTAHDDLSGPGRLSPLLFPGDLGSLA
eukprot:324693-Pyramimonas_sp.AAC.1